MTDKLKSKAATREALQPEDELDILKHSLRAHKGHLTRALATTDNLLAIAHDDPAPFLVAKLESALVKVEEQYHKISQIYTDLQTLDPDNFNTYEAAINEFTQITSTHSREVIAMIRDCLQANVIPQAPPQQAPQPAAAQIKTNNVWELLR